MVVTPDRSRLQAFGLEECRVYHGDDVVGRRTVELGAGGVAWLVDTQDQGAAPGADGARLSVVHWEAPFLLDGRPMHARLALFAGPAEARGFAPAQQRGLAPGGPAFEQADETLVALARAITQQVLDAGGRQSELGVGT